MCEFLLVLALASDEGLTLRERCFPTEQACEAVARENVSAKRDDELAIVRCIDLINYVLRDR